MAWGWTAIPESYNSEFTDRFATAASVLISSGISPPRSVRWLLRSTRKPNLGIPYSATGNWRRPRCSHWSPHRWWLTASTIASSSLTPYCLRTPQRLRVRPRPHRGADRRGAVKPFTVGTRHEFGEFGVREPRRHDMRRTFSARRSAPPLLQFVDVVPGFGFNSPRLHLCVGNFTPLNSSLTYTHYRITKY